MTLIRCFTCHTFIKDSDTITPAELAAQNNWLAVEIGHVEGYLCEQCSKWLNSPIRIWRYDCPEYFEIKQVSPNYL